MIYNDDFLQLALNNIRFYVTRLNGVCTFISYVDGEMLYFVNDAFIIIIFRSFSFECCCNEWEFSASNTQKNIQIGDSNSNIQKRLIPLPVI